MPACGGPNTPPVLRSSPGRRGKSPREEEIFHRVMSLTAIRPWQRRDSYPRVSGDLHSRFDLIAMDWVLPPEGMAVGETAGSGRWERTCVRGRNDNSVHERGS